MALDILVDPGEQFRPHAGKAIADHVATIVVAAAAAVKRLT